MKRHTFLPLHQGDCVEETPCVVEQYERFRDAESLMAYSLVSHSPRCRCGEPLIHVDPSQEQLRAAYHLNEAESV